MSDASIIDRIVRRLQMAIGRGRINTVNDAGSVQYVQVSYSAIETKDNVPRVMEYGYSSNPPKGTDALLAHISGDRSNGIVVGTNHQPSRPTGLAIGEAMLYQMNGLQVYLSNGGIVIDAAALPVVVNSAQSVVVNAVTTIKLVAPTDVEIDTPLFKVSGDIIDNFGTNANTMAQMREKYDEHTHNVQEVQGGGSTITTTIPSVIE